MIQDFEAIPVSGEKKIKVGIVGEIWMKYAPIGNNYLDDFLIREGMEPVLSGVMDFAMYCLKKQHSRCRLLWFLYQNLIGE